VTKRRISAAVMKTTGGSSKTDAAVKMIAVSS
jgi:hypothetical protein